MMSELSRITGAEDDARTARGFPGDDAMEEDERAPYDGFGIDDDASDEYDGDSLRLPDVLFLRRDATEGLFYKVFRRQRVFWRLLALPSFASLHVTRP